VAAGTQQSASSCHFVNDVVLCILISNFRSSALMAIAMNVAAILAEALILILFGCFCDNAIIPVFIP
jgi:hypothetical protein